MATIKDSMAPASSGAGKERFPSCTLQVLGLYLQESTPLLLFLGKLQVVRSVAELRVWGKVSDNLSQRTGNLGQVSANLTEKLN